MAFKNLTDRFNNKMNELYGKYSTTDGRDGQPSAEPYIEIKPNNPSRNKLGRDSRLSPLNTIEIDAKRLLKFSKSGRGLLWYLDQQNLQAGNTFSETRIINPAFVLENVQPYKHFKRPLAVASNEELGGDVDEKSEGATNNIGAAGRLQKGTKQKIISTIAHGGTNNIYSKIIKLIPPNRITQTIDGLVSITQNGILGVNERPELDMNNNGRFDSFYSVAIWNGFKKTDPNGIDYFSRIGNNLRKGNIIGAAKSLSKGISELFKTGKSVVNSITGKNEIVSRNQRYFINSSTNADRYLRESIDMDGQFPRASAGFLDRVPFLLKGTPETVSVTVMSGTTSKKSSISNINSVINNGLNFSIKTIPSLNSSISALGFINQLKSQAKNFSGIPKENVAEEKMLYSNTSIQSMYKEDDRLNFIRESLKTQMNDWLASQPSNKTGFNGGISAGRELIPDPYSKYKFIVSDKDVSGRRKYFFDSINSQINAIQENSKDSLSVGVSAENIKTDRLNAETLIDLYFYDYVNQKTISFRAYITNLTENVSPEFSETPYIGRIERNIVYSGVKREVSFSLMVHAFNDEELKAIWRKINYLSGLCFPSGYDNGFMVPPFVKLTLGDVYNNQPGYIKSITNTVEENTPWEITPELQLPHGMTINISFAIIEKKQMSSVTIDYDPENPSSDSIPLYAFGQPRSTQQVVGSLTSKDVQDIGEAFSIPSIGF